MYDVITVGSATVDAFVETENRLFQNCKDGHVKVPFGSKILINNIRFDTGGGGTNTAVVFSRLGLKTAWIGRVDNGHNGKWILDKMKSEKVDTRFVTKSDTISGYSVILDAKAHDRTILAYKGCNDEISTKYFPISQLKAKWIYICSLTGPSFKASEQVAEYAIRHNIKTAFNPSAYLAKKGKHFLKKILRNTTVLVLNKEEAQYISKKASFKAQLMTLKALGPKIVIVTDGKNGSRLFDGKDFYSIIPPKVKVVETTGAGDAFASGFVAGLIKTHSIEKALQLGQKQAESVISHPGAKNKILTWKQSISFPSRKVVKALIE